ncbi:ixochymostatin-like [Haemaphysalis longicornis]
MPRLCCQPDLGSRGMATALAICLALTALLVTLNAAHTDAKKCLVGGEVFRASKQGCPESTCDQPDAAGQCQGPSVQGCFCQPGLFRNKQRACVTREEC